ncbi:putative transcriptional regulator [Piscirickettsia salmonis]|uniref:helix-turn-helix domain-containing protein n=1 Tax=Piscirickettsia salmonis TaxID=1238 RepID=UPI0012B86BDC|nr:helix-turn-helix transcriptional regulator [Piscirickettsia salmonis]QGP50594.1 putative transcriptional regulator [Piscirickettsia salmonis]QGP54199.1 putative transcriptional regulator [Piscirickettsia salmonis]QGP59902.1 putative transcriptional regulator [Piscirickettsia salmonis]QGP63776.1 putative transcriptional regulator [Piscirickettsia salmonis]
MAIIINIDVQLAKRKVKASELANYIGITAQNLSILKNGKAKAIRISTLEAICEYLECQPGDILEYRPEEPKISEEKEASKEA